MPKSSKEIGSIGTIPVLVLLSVVAILAFLVISNSFEFRDNIFSKLYPKSQSQASEEPPSVPGEIIVKYRTGTSESIKSGIRNGQGATTKGTIQALSVETVSVPNTRKGSVINSLRQNPNVEYAEPNYIAKTLTTTPNDTYYGPFQWGPVKIGMPAAWDITKGSSSMPIGLIDSGVKADFPDLVGKILPGYNFIDNNINTADVTGHGTAAGGIIGAVTNNSQGVASVGWNTPIIPLRVVDSLGFSTYADISEAIIYAADHGIKVVNISLGGVAPSVTLQNAVNYAFNKGVVVVAAAGNSGISGIAYPAASNNVLAVGASDGSDLKATFSSTGQGLDVMAPGLGIRTTDISGGYNAWSGTSFAAPHVSALAVLMINVNPSLAPQRIMDIITGTSKDLGVAGWDDQTGCGRIDALKAIQVAQGSLQLPTNACKGTSGPTSSVSTPIPSATPTASQTPGSATGTYSKSGSTPTPSPTPVLTPTPIPTFSPSPRPKI